MINIKSSKFKIILPINKNISNIEIYRTKVSTFVLCILPIFSPYSLMNSLSFNMVLLAVTILGLFTLNGKMNIRNTVPVLLLWFLHFILSLTAIFSTNASNALSNSLIVGSYTIICICILWSNSDLSLFKKYINFTGVICSLFLIYQAICLIFSLEAPNGRLFGLELLEYAGWVSTTWGFRLNSFFQEPSYFAIYILPILAINLSDKKYKNVIFYIFSLVLCSSSLGIIGAIFVLLYHFVIIEKKINKFILLSIIAFFVHLILYIILPYYTSSFNRSLNKIMDLDTDSAIRLTGQIHLYDNLPSINKLFGVGISQLSNFFSSKGIYIPNYSNAFVITLFNTGIIGLFIFIMFFLCLLFKWKKKVIYILICIMICAVDYFIYSFFFYYVLGFVFIESKSSKYSN